MSIEEQNSWSQNEILKYHRVPSIKNIEIRCSAKFTFFLLLSFSRSRFFSRFFLPCLPTDINIQFRKIHEIDTSRTFLPRVQNENSHNAREASINRYGDI